jgi:hypothetical protein
MNCVKTLKVLISHYWKESFWKRFQMQGTVLSSPTLGNQQPANPGNQIQGTVLSSLALGNQQLLATKCTAQCSLPLPLATKYKDGALVF